MDSVLYSEKIYKMKLNFADLFAKRIKKNNYVIKIST